MSIFASQVQQTVPIPFDPPHTVTVQKLSGRKLHKAAQVFLNDLIAGVQERGGAAVQKDIEQLFKAGDGVKAEIAKVKADPLNGFDKQALIRYGVKAWSYDKPVTVESFEDLDEESETFMATEVLRLTKPSAFQTAEESETDQKNG